MSREKIEQVLLGEPAVMADPFPDEPRLRAIGKTRSGSYLFLVFMLREIGGQTRLRPISARYMHQREVDYYENQSQDHAVAAERHGRRGIHRQG